MSLWKPLSQIVGATLIAGVASAIALSPVAALGSVAVVRTNETMQSNLEDLEVGDTPGVTTITDKDGNPFAWLYDQRRYEIPPDAIAQSMKDAIVAIEDRRFYEHNGVDIQGNIRAMATNFLAGGVEQGASTLNQQYVKNYLLLVTADTEEEQQAAVETSIPRKLREMRMASAIDNLLSKDEVLARYLNLVPFGNNAYGVEAAAQTYFGIPASQLTVPQSAMLAGMVQSSSYLNPYTNPDGVLERRNTVLDAMVSFGVLSQGEADAYSQEPLGVLEEPATLPNGCIATGNRGFFCDYVVNYLEEKGLKLADIQKGAYTIHTTLDPVVQDSVHDSMTSQVDAHAPGVAEVMNVIEPGQDSRHILAMASSRDYGLDLEAGQTVLPQTSSLVGNGAGSVFKIFTAGVALEQGYGLDNQLAVPRRVEVSGMGVGGAAGCPPGKYCVENAGDYAPSMSLRDALAFSPNTTFVQLIEQVTVPAVVDLAVKLGLRSYETPGSYDGEQSIAEFIKSNNLGSFTLGPTAVNALELSNVAATLSSGGVWCEPSPILDVTDKDGREVFIDTPGCEDVLDEDVAYALAAGMSADVVRGTGAGAASTVGWGSPLAAKTGTTESHQSAAFLAFNDRFAAATYAYNDGTEVSPLCTSPLRQCSWGDLYGGYEPARTWLQAALASGAAEGGLPSPKTEFNQGRMSELSNKYAGRNADEVERELVKEGYKVQRQMVIGNGTARGSVVRVVADLPLREGTTVMLHVSDGSTFRPEPNGVAPRPQSPRADDIEEDINTIADELLSIFGIE